MRKKNIINRDTGDVLDPLYGQKLGVGPDFGRGANGQSAKHVLFRRVWR